MRTRCVKGEAKGKKNEGTTMRYGLCTHTTIGELGLGLGLGLGLELGLGEIRIMRTHTTIDNLCSLHVRRCLLPLLVFHCIPETNFACARVGAYD